LAEHDQGTRSDPETWVTERTGHMGDTFGPNGFSRGSSPWVYKSQVLNSGRIASILFGRGLLGPDFGILVTREGRAAFLLGLGCAALHALGFLALATCASTFPW
jgi:hypothetical protein